MPTRIAINGFGRIGRLVPKAAYRDPPKDTAAEALKGLHSPNMNIKILNRR